MDDEPTSSDICIIHRIVTMRPARGDFKRRLLYQGKFELFTFRADELFI